ncbi:hypothetical protein RQP46_000421 [Phenoliferia psychrophenolica]
MPPRRKSAASERRPPPILSAADLAIARNHTAELVQASTAAPSPAPPAPVPVPAPAPAPVEPSTSASAAGGDEPQPEKRKKKKKKKHDRQADSGKGKEVEGAPAPPVVAPVKDDAAVAERAAHKDVKRAKKAANVAKKLAKEAAATQSPPPPAPSPSAPTPASPSAAKLKRDKARVSQPASVKAAAPQPTVATSSKKRSRDATDDDDSSNPGDAPTTTTLPPPKKRKRNKTASQAPSVPPAPPATSAPASASSKRRKQKQKSRNATAEAADASEHFDGSSAPKGKGKQVEAAPHDETPAVVAPAPQPFLSAFFASKPNERRFFSDVDPLFALRGVLFPPGWFGADEPATATSTESAPSTDLEDAATIAIRQKKAKVAAKRQRRAEKKAALAQSSAPGPSKANSAAPAALVAGPAPRVVISPPEIASAKNSGTSEAQPPVLSTKRPREAQDVVDVVREEAATASGSQRSTGSARKTKRVRSKKLAAQRQKGSSPDASAVDIAASTQNDGSPVGARSRHNENLNSEEVASRPAIVVTSPPAMNEELHVVEDSADDADVDELEGATQREQASTPAAPRASSSTSDESEHEDANAMDVDELEGSTQRFAVEPSPELDGTDPTNFETESTLTIPPARRLMSIGEQPSDAELEDDITFSSQPLEASQFDDPLFPESQYVRLVKDTPLFLESQGTQETQETQVAQRSSGVALDQLPEASAGQETRAASPEEPATQVDSQEDVHLVGGAPQQKEVEAEEEEASVDEPANATQNDDVPQATGPVLRQSARARLATRSPSPSGQASTAPTSAEDTEAPKKAAGKATAIAAPQRRRGASSQDSALKKATATPTSSSRPVRASRMLSLSQIDEKATRKASGTPKSSQKTSSQPSGSQGGKKAWLAKGDGDDSEEEATPRKGGKSLWG